MPEATANTTCLACGYALATLDDDAACPECGLSIAASRRGSLIDPDDAATLRALERGLAGLWVSLIGPAALAVAGVGVSASQSIAAYGHNTPRSLFVPSMLAVGAVGESLWARRIVLRVTATSTHHAESLRPARVARRAAAWCVPAAAGVAAAAILSTAPDAPLSAAWLLASTLCSWITARTVTHGALARHLPLVLGSILDPRFPAMSLPQALWLRTACVVVAAVALAAATGWPATGQRYSLPLQLAAVSGMVWSLVTLFAFTETRDARAALKRIRTARLNAAPPSATR